ncbi:MAG: HAMP domain-containing histidine kinase [Myxococcales bacterium]|nr:HAMP domain-containing histidine kinase [Myxococcales bacterium]
MPLAVFDPEDRATVVALYAFLGEVLRVASSDEALRGPQPLLEMTETHGLADLVDRVKKLGRAPQGSAPKDVIHDIRGGAFNALFLQISRVRSGSFRRAWIASIAFLARDHRKMMRSLVADLDPEARARDLETIPHRLTTLVEALREFPAEVGGRRLDVDVTVDGPLDPTIAESCVECGAIDRIAYNLLNNAVRHAEPPRVWVSFLSVGDDLRVIVQNRVSSADRAALEATLSPDASVLFGAFSTTGSGQGLQIVTHLVGSAYGVPDSGELLRGGYVGAQLRGGLFTTWFHWPLSGA